MAARWTIGLGLCTLLVLLGILGLDPGEPDAPPVGAPADSGEAPGATAARVAALEAAVAAERAAREALAFEVAALRSELSRRDDAEMAASAPVEEVLPSAKVVAPAPGPPLAAPVFDERSLVEAGFDPREAARLREQTEQLELEQLYLRDRAVREGWAGTPRFAEEARALDARGRALREELGDDRYDWLLFAAGRPNRVIVQSVMERSPASEGGLQAGDAILSYGGTRLFDVSTLRDATTGGRAGESVAVDVARGGERLRLYVPRGPLGIRLEELRQRPAS